MDNLLGWQPLTYRNAGPYLGVFGRPVNWVTKAVPHAPLSLQAEAEGAAHGQAGCRELHRASDFRSPPTPGPSQTPLEEHPAASW